MTGHRTREGWSLWRLRPAVWRLRHPVLLPVPRYFPSLHLAIAMARALGGDTAAGAQ